MGGGAQIRALILAWVGLFLASCGDSNNKPSPIYQTGFFGGVALKSYPRKEVLRPGDLYRTLRPGPFYSLDDLRPLCTKDVDFIRPLMRPQNLPDVDRMVEANSAAAASLLSIDVPGSLVGAKADVVEGVRVQFSGVTREFLEESEIQRLSDNLGIACRNIIRSLSGKDLSVFMIDGIVAAKQVTLVARHKTPVPNLDLKKIGINGIRALSEQQQTTFHVASDVIIEIFVTPISLN